MSRVLRCVACTRRIRDHHPHIGVVDLETGSEWTYHARPRCQERAAQETAARLERGKVYMLNHYHVCDDETAGAVASRAWTSRRPADALSPAHNTRRAFYNCRTALPRLDLGRAEVPLFLPLQSNSCSSNNCSMGGDAMQIEICHASARRRKRWLVREASGHPSESRDGRIGAGSTDNQTP